MTTYSSVLQAAMKLSRRERLQLVDALCKTLDEHQQPRLSDAWRQEIARRSAEIDAGTAKFVTWEEMRRRARGAAGHDG